MPALLALLLGMPPAPMMPAMSPPAKPAAEDVLAAAADEPTDPLLYEWLEISRLFLAPLPFEAPLPFPPSGMVGFDLYWYSFEHALLLM